VPDSTTSAIDRVFDLVDNGVEKIDRVLNRTKYTEEQHRTRRSSRRAEVIDTAPVVKVKKAEASASSTAIATRKFRIVETTSQSGQMIFAVTNGGSARAECTSRELAEKILRALEASP
jgi:hypothetical protein